MLQAWQSHVACLCHETMINLTVLSLTRKSAECLIVTELACVAYLSVLVAAVMGLQAGQSVLKNKCGIEYLSDVCFPAAVANFLANFIANIRQQAGCLVECC
ncbi:hypothetical protein ABBQ38_002560 [Trebouxia sp. C0009 RCD-2024]